MSTLTLCALVWPLVIGSCSHLETVARESLLSDDLEDTTLALAGGKSHACSVTENTDEVSYDVSFLFYTSSGSNGCNLVQCQNFNFFNHILPKMIMTQPSAKACGCWMSKEYTESVEAAYLFSFLVGKGGRGACTPSACWHRYADVQTAFARKLNPRLTPPSFLDAFNHWKTKCEKVDGRTVAVTMPSIGTKVKQLRDEGKGDVVDDNKHLFVDETEGGTVAVDETLAALPSPWSRGDTAYYTGPDKESHDGTFLKYGQPGEVIDLSKQTGPNGEPWLAVQFHDNKLTDVDPVLLSKVAPPKYLTGDFKEKEKVYWKGDDQLGGAVKYGQDGVVLREHDDDHLIVAFDDEVRLIAPLDKLTKEPPPTVFLDGWKLNEPVYYIGDGLTWQDGDELKYGDSGKIVGPSKEDDKVRAEFGGKRSDFNTALLARELPEEKLPGGFQRDQKVYYKGMETKFNDGSELTFGTAGIVHSPTKPKTEDKVVVRFDQKLVPLHHEKLSVEPLGTVFAGGFGLNDEVYYTGEDKTFACHANPLRHGSKGKVTGSSDRPGMVTVRFHNMQYRTDVSPSQISRQAPHDDFGHGWAYGDCVYYTGIDVTLPDGMMLTKGHKGSVVGASEGHGDQDSNRIVVRFDGFQQTTNLHKHKLTKDAPVLQGRNFLPQPLPAVTLD